MENKVVKDGEVEDPNQEIELLQAQKLNQILKLVRMFQRKLNLLTLVCYAKILFQNF